MRFIPLCLLFCVGLFLNACQTPISSADDSLNYIPAEANMVVALHLPTLMEKSDFSSVQEMGLFQHIIADMGEENPAMAAIFADPAKAGIDTDQHMYITYSLQPDLNEEERMSISMTVKDKSALEAHLKTRDVQYQNATNFEHTDQIGPFMVGWNEEAVVFAGGGNTPDPQTYLASLFSLDTDQSIASNRNLRKCMSADFDIAVWMNGALFLERNPMLESMASLLEYDAETLAQNYLHNFVFFEEDKVETKTNYYIQPAIANDLDLLIRKAHQSDVVSQIPTEELDGIVTAALEPRGINQLIIEKHTKGFARSALGQLGLSMEDLLSTSNGDVVLAAYSRKDSTQQRSRLSLLFGTKIENNQALDSLLAKATQAKLVQAVDEQTYELLSYEEYVQTDTGSVAVNNMLQGYIYQQEGYLFVVSNEFLLAQLQSGKVGQSAMIAAAQKAAKQEIFSFHGNILEFIPDQETSDAFPVKKTTILTNQKDTRGVFEIDTEGKNALEYLWQRANEEFEGTSSKETKI
ncbi:MAG: DUF4836 family protein [Bacteroidota bacterium]